MATTKTNSDTLIHQLHATPLRLALVVTGGGAGLLASLLRIPGASRTVLDAQIPYAEAALRNYLGALPTSYCSATAAMEMARVAYGRAIRLAPSAVCAGVSCTAALATDRPKQGSHRAYLAIHTSTTQSVQGITLDKGARSRAEEEQVVEALLLNLIAETAGLADRVPVPLRPADEITRDIYEMTTDCHRLITGEIATLSREPDGQLRVDAPPPRLLLPGSFNPLHRAHRELADRAAAHFGEPVEYELSIVNVDKPELDEATLRLRGWQFQNLARLRYTRTPRFDQKATLFPGVRFVIGADTALRLIAPRYYGDDLFAVMKRYAVCKRRAANF